MNRVGVSGKLRFWCGTSRKFKERERGGKEMKGREVERNTNARAEKQNHLLFPSYRVLIDRAHTMSYIS